MLVFRWCYDAWAKAHPAEVERMLRASPVATDMVQRRQDGLRQREQERWI